MNISVIFAGGTGSRMQSGEVPKQFLKVDNKEIILYTIDHFEHHPDIDAIVVVCLESWIAYLKDILKANGNKKVTAIVPGGETGQLSIFNGVKYAHDHFPGDSIVLIHDGVRPLINKEIITQNIEMVKIKGSCITTAPAIETVIRIKNQSIEEVIDRSQCVLAKAPQSFLLGQLYDTHCRAISEGRTNEIDSATLMSHYAFKLHTIDGPHENIKITTPNDFYMFQSLQSAINHQKRLGE